uniref:Patatin like phospholipase domain containing 2 n=1 Tax=Macaca fascicularis TaxID=9541 RepID=A0A7N9CGH3_MACFA
MPSGPVCVSHPPGWSDQDSAGKGQTPAGAPRLRCQGEGLGRALGPR